MNSVIDMKFTHKNEYLKYKIVTLFALIHSV